MAESLPSTGDDARINNGGTDLIDSTQNISMLLVVMADTNATIGTLRMTGGTLTTTSDIRVGGNSTTVLGGTGFFEQSGGEVTMNGGNLNIGIGLGSMGNYNLSGGSMQLNPANPIFAIGNRNTGRVNQSGGTIYLRNVSGLTQLGRNVAASSGFGTYRLSGGTLATSRLQFGNAISTNATISTNTFELSTNGVLMVGSISNINTAAVNSFNFTGGTLTVMACAIPLTNNGGVLSPAAIDFASAAGTNIASLPVNPIGTNVFIGANNYVQNSGMLAIDIAGAGNNDFVDIGAGASVASATLAGMISVRLLNGYRPVVGKTFDVLAADSIINSATITANPGAAFSSSLVPGSDGQWLIPIFFFQQRKPHIHHLGHHESFYELVVARCGHGINAGPIRVYGRRRQRSAFLSSALAVVTGGPW